MHETAICSALLAQVEAVAQQHDARAVTRVRLQIGPLAGIEPALLQRAYALARAGTVAAGADLEIDTAEVRVACTACGAETVVAPQRTVCGACGDWRTRLVAGDELVLAQVELVPNVH